MEKFIFVVCLICSTAAQLCHNYTTCPNSCTDWLHYNTDNIASLEGDSPEFIAFQQTVAQVLDYMIQYSGVIDDNRYVLHTTVQYLCCYSIEQYETIADIINNMTWTPINVTFNSIQCNYHDNLLPSWNSVDIFMDEPSTQAMMAFVERIENAMTAAGIPVHHPRSTQEPFHCTLAVVDSSYPMQQVLEAIQSQYPVFNPQPLPIDHFFMVLPFHEFYAN